MNQLKRVNLYYTEMDEKQVTALLTQAGKETNLEYLVLGIKGRDPGEVVDKDIVRLAMLNIRDLMLRNVTGYI